MWSRGCRLPLRASVLALGLVATSVDRAGPAVALAQSSGVQGKIAFTSNRDGNDEIYVMNADGTGVTRLTDNPASDQQPAWSPDGSRIAFTSTRDGNFDIYVMNADGTGVTRLTTTTTHRGSTLPAWCGNRIAFESDRYLEYFPDIFVMNEDGTGITRLTIANADFDQQPAWSPDCRRIAFTKDPSGSAEIYVMNANGTGVNGVNNGIRPDESPAWSPDGVHIAFTSTQDYQPPFSEVYVMNADGTSATRLTDGPGWVRHPVWSSDGGQLAFVSHRDDDDEISVMNADGTGVTQLTNNAFSDRDPAWSRGSPAETGVWPNEPARFIQLDDQPWDALTKLELAATRKLPGPRHRRGRHGTVLAAERAADDLHYRHGGWQRAQRALDRIAGRRRDLHGLVDQVVTQLDGEPRRGRPHYIPLFRRRRRASVHRLLPSMCLA